MKLSQLKAILTLALITSSALADNTQLCNDLLDPPAETRELIKKIKDKYTNSPDGLDKMLKNKTLANQKVQDYYAPSLKSNFTEITDFSNNKKDSLFDTTVKFTPTAKSFLNTDFSFGSSNSQMNSPSSNYNSFGYKLGGGASAEDASSIREQIEHVESINSSLGVAELDTIAKQYKASPKKIYTALKALGNDKQTSNKNDRINKCKSRLILLDNDLDVDLTGSFINEVQINKLLEKQKEAIANKATKQPLAGDCNKSEQFTNQANSCTELTTGILSKNQAISKFDTLQTHLTYPLTKSKALEMIGKNAPDKFCSKCFIDKTKGFFSLQGKKLSFLNSMDSDFAKEDENTDAIRALSSLKKPSDNFKVLKRNSSAKIVSEIKSKRIRNALHSISPLAEQFYNYKAWFNIKDEQFVGKVDCFTEKAFAKVLNKSCKRSGNAKSIEAKTNNLFKEFSKMTGNKVNSFKDLSTYYVGKVGEYKVSNSQCKKPKREDFIKAKALSMEGKNITETVRFLTDTSFFPKAEIQNFKQLGISPIEYLAKKVASQASHKDLSSFRHNPLYQLFSTNTSNQSSNSNYALLQIFADSKAKDSIVSATFNLADDFNSNFITANAKEELIKKYFIGFFKNIAKYNPHLQQFFYDKDRFLEVIKDKDSKINKNNKTISEHLSSFKEFAAPICKKFHEQLSTVACADNDEKILKSATPEEIAQATKSYLKKNFKKEDLDPEETVTALAFASSSCSLSNKANTNPSAKDLNTTNIEDMQLTQSGDFFNTIEDSFGGNLKSKTPNDFKAYANSSLCNTRDKINPIFDCSLGQNSKNSECEVVVIAESLQKDLDKEKRKIARNGIRKPEVTNQADLQRIQTETSNKIAKENTDMSFGSNSSSSSSMNFTINNLNDGSFTTYNKPLFTEPSSYLGLTTFKKSSTSSSSFTNDLYTPDPSELSLGKITNDGNSTLKEFSGTRVVPKETLQAKEFATDLPIQPEKYSSIAAGSSNTNYPPASAQSYTPRTYIEESKISNTRVNKAVDTIQSNPKEVATIEDEISDEVVSSYSLTKDEIIEKALKKTNEKSDELKKLEAERSALIKQQIAAIKQETLLREKEIKRLEASNLKSETDKVERKPASINPAVAKKMQPKKTLRAQQNYATNPYALTEANSTNNTQTSFTSNTNQFSKAPKKSLIAPRKVSNTISRGKAIINLVKSSPTTKSASNFSVSSKGDDEYIVLRNKQGKTKEFNLTNIDEKSKKDILASITSNSDLTKDEIASIKKILDQKEIKAINKSDLIAKKLKRIEKEEALGRAKLEALNKLLDKYRKL